MQILEDLSKAKILVVGDVMVDRYWWGTVNRISPEAPVPIVQLEQMSIVAGGAANVAANIAGLGATPYLFGVRGNDSEGDMLPAVLSAARIENHVIVPISGRKTTIKTRIVAHSQHVVRIDQETVEPISNEDADHILVQILAVLNIVDAVIISDYAKGLLTDYLLAALTSEVRSSHKLLVVDPKGRDFKRYKGATVMTPNKREAADACSVSHDLPGVVSQSGKLIMENMDLNALLITEGEDGMTLFRDTAEPLHIPSVARNVYDVTGAGDTVIASLAVALSTGLDVSDSAEIANIAAGLVIEQIGTTVITKSLLQSTFAEMGKKYS
jgi:D-beta-D-heptose 7-phosphate kinase/D-beta-D-heptose 1-phosphate adenosyltransferase